MTANNIVVGDIDVLRIAYARRPFSEALKKDGDRYPVMCLLEATLEARDPYALGLITLS
jgi:hypothetical protein